MCYHVFMKKLKLIELKKGQKIAVIAAFIMAVLVIFSTYMMFGKYDGLGLKMPVEENRFHMSNLYYENGRAVYEDDQFTSVTGIDVSEFQGEIDWEAVKSDGIGFVMIRLGFRGSENGALVLDSKFKENLKGAKKVGLDVGVYFFSQAITPEEAIEEARYVMKHIRGKGVHYPVAFDMEPIDGTERTADLTKEEKTAIADAFCQVIDRNGHTPMIYGNPKWMRKHIDLGYLSDYDKWLAHYTEATSYKSSFTMWQYTDSGSVEGIYDPVDMNLYFYNK